jgi:hypothetical protein
MIGSWMCGKESLVATALKFWTNMESLEQESGLPWVSSELLLLLYHYYYYIITRLLHSAKVRDPSILAAKPANAEDGENEDNSGDYDEDLRPKGDSRDYEGEEEERAELDDKSESGLYRLHLIYCKSKIVSVQS